MPARIVRLDGQTAEVDVGGHRVRVALTVLDEPVAVGDWLLVHSGIALLRLDEPEAVQRLRLLDAMIIKTPTIDTTLLDVAKEDSP